jgi:hypothetical protein
MSIHQFNGSYLANEDRILFRFNTQNKEEYRLWFTRRICLFLLAAMAHLLSKKMEQGHTPEAASAINTFQKEAASKEIQQESPASQVYESGAQYPLGFDPLLVVDVSCSLANTAQKEGGAEHSLISTDFKLPGGANLNLTLPDITIQAVCVLLDQLKNQAGWGEFALKENEPITPVDEAPEDGGTQAQEKPAIH